MIFDYIVSGISIVNDIVLNENSISKNILGGCCVFAYGGIRAFTPSVVPVTSGGQDFHEIYGRYWENNNIPSEGVYLTMPYTHHTLMNYSPDGSWYEHSLYGDEYFAEQSSNCNITFEKIKPFLHIDLKGLYLDSNSFEGIFDHIDEIRTLSPNVRIMWEPTTVSYTDSRYRDLVLKNIQKVDYFSCNLNEARVFFGFENRSEIVTEIQKTKRPCFLREGEKGSSWIESDNDTGTISSIEPELSIDPTGCGNCSTASALYLKCEGYSPKNICKGSNWTASLTSKQRGPIRNLNLIKCPPYLFEGK